MAEESKEKFRKLDDLIDESLIEKRRVFLSDQVDMDTANDVIRKMWYLEYKDPGKPILFIINSPGGSVDAGFAIWDQAKMISSPIATLVTGLAASMGSILSLCADKGMRYSTKNARIMIHQPRVQGVIRGQATDLEIQAEEILKTRSALVDIYVQATGRTKEEIEKRLDRDNWYTPQEALEFGLLDKIVENFSELKEFA